MGLPIDPLLILGITITYELPGMSKMEDKLLQDTRTHILVGKCQSSWPTKPNVKIKKRKLFNKNID